MRKAFIVGGAVMTVWTILVACSSTNSSGGFASVDSGPAPLSNQGADFVAACNAQATAYCALYEKCAPIAFKILYVDANDCQSREQNVCVHYGTFPEVGTTTDYVNKCAATYQQASCDQLYQPYPCGVVTGSRNLDDVCQVDAQCKSGVCILDEGTCGHCKEPSGQFEQCVTQTCDSKQGLECISGRCEKPIPAMGACQSGINCADGLVCVHGMCAAGGNMGDACDVSEAPCNPHLGVACDQTSMKCVAATFAAPGEECDYAGPRFCSYGYCQPGAADGGILSACVPLVGEGAPCGQPVLCNSSLICIAEKCGDLPVRNDCF